MNSVGANMCWSQRKCKRAALLLCLKIVFSSLLINIIWELYNIVQLCQAGTTTFGYLHKTRLMTWLPLSFFFPHWCRLRRRTCPLAIINVHCPLRGGSHSSQEHTRGLAERWRKPRTGFTTIFLSDLEESSSVPSDSLYHLLNIIGVLWG